jgi:DNA replication protein
MSGFPGFPAGKVSFTPLPDMFFSHLLPMVDDLAELKVTLHIFWRLNRMKGYPRCLTLRDLLLDGALLRGLRVPGRNPESVLQEALERAVSRGTLLRLASSGEEQAAWYFVNTQEGREAVEKINRGDIPLPGVERFEEPELVAERPTVFALYEQNIGLLQPMIAEELREAQDLYPADWIEEAFRIAVGNNVRNWRYIRAILERWVREGKDEGKGPPEEEKSWYTKDEYERFIKH